jgi:hypothetical protein
LNFGKRQRQEDVTSTAAEAQGWISLIFERNGLLGGEGNRTNVSNRDWQGVPGRSRPLCPSPKHAPYQTAKPTQRRIELDAAHAAKPRR